MSTLLASRPSASGTPRLQQLKAAARKPGEASFFWYETQFNSEAVKVLPGEYFVHDEDMLIWDQINTWITFLFLLRMTGLGTGSGAE